MDETFYDTDMMAWADEQADALRARDWQALDIAHLLEELALVKERYVTLPTAKAGGFLGYACVDNRYVSA